MSNHQTTQMAETYYEDPNPIHKAAAEGSHLPSLQELLGGCPFMHDDLRRDALAWAQAARPLVAGLDPNAAAVLDQMLETPTKSGFEDSASQLRKMAGGLTGNELSAAADRAAFYAASLGCSDAALHTARAAAELSKTSGMKLSERQELARIAIGWLWESTSLKASVGLFRQFRFSPRVRVNHFSASTLALLADRPTPSHAAGEDELPMWTPEQKGQVERERRRNTESKPQPNAAVTDDISLMPQPNTVMVMARVGNSLTSAGQRIAEEMQEFVGHSFPLVSAPDLAVAKALLLAEFPHLSSVIDIALGDMHDGSEVKVRPLLLIGKPGTGKSRLAVRLLQVLGVSPTAYACGGVADASIAGTARKWDSAGPSWPLARILDTRVANPGIILDELEKTASSRHNGNATDALLNLLEPMNSATWVDPYVEAPVDLSHVCWTATANTTQGLSKPLLDRFQVVRLPDPGPDHLEALGNSLIRAVADSFSLHPVLAQPLDGIELRSLSHYWQGGSVRSLAKLVNGVLKARNVPHGPKQ